MSLTKEQEKLFDQLYKEFREEDNDVNHLLQKIENRKDFLAIFGMSYKENRDTILGSSKLLDNLEGVKRVQAVLNRAKELDIPLADILNMQVFLFDSESRNISLFELMDSQFISKVTSVINKTYGYESLMDLMCDYSDNLGNTVNTLGKACEIQKNLENRLKKKAANKAIVAGAICGVIAGLAVGGGLFAAGVALPISTMIGIAVASAVLTGLVAGGITYEMSKPSEKLDRVDAGQKAITAEDVRIVK